MSDDFLDAELVKEGAVGEMRRVLEMRRVAAEAFIKVKSQEACARASRARTRTAENLKQSGKPQWMGSEQVLAEEGPNL